MNKTKLILGASILLLVSVQVNASIINEHTINTEYSAGQFANLQDLEWFSLDMTQGQSRSSVEGGYGGYADLGWRYSTREEAETLTGSLWGNAVSGWSSTNFDGAHWFLETFGGLWTNTTTATDNYVASHLFYGSNLECSSGITLSCWGTVAKLDNFIDDLDGVNIGTGVSEVTYIANTGRAGWQAQANA